MNEAAIKESPGWSHASLRIFGEALRPEEIDRALGIEATRTHLKGQPRSSRRKEAVWLESAWLLRSPLDKHHQNLAEHLRWLLDCLEPKAGVVRALSGKYRMDFFCGFSSGNRQGGFTLDSTTLSRIAKLGLPLGLDLYPPGAAETSEM